MTRAQREFREAVRDGYNACRDARECFESAAAAELRGDIFTAVSDMAEARVHSELAGSLALNAAFALRGRRDRAKKAAGHGIEKNPVERKSPRGAERLVEEIISGQSTMPSSVLRGSPEERDRE